jgi:ADP-heptose:LPS heptosyltransferase
MGDLPRLLRRRESDFAAASRPYLTADPARRAALRARYADGRPLVGIAWATRNRTALQRSMPPSALAPLLRDSGLRCVSLQYGDAAMLAEETRGLPLLIDPEVDALASIEEALAQVAAMDLVVSVDNSTVHFAGALGVPCHALLPLNAEWRWMTGRADTPWYAGVRLSRRQRGESWEAMVERVAGDLRRDAKNIQEGTCGACEK